MNHLMLERRVAAGALIGAILAVAAAIPAAARAQSLEARVNAAGNGAVQFSFPSRPEVCGNGRGMLSIGTSTFIGSGTYMSGDTRQACEPGPVRVVITRAEGTLTAVETYVGAAGTSLPEVRDLGEVAPREAADYLLSLASRLEGKPGRDAVMPAALAQGVDVWQRLIAIARDEARPRETRGSAITWTARLASELGGAPPAAVAGALATMANDANGNRQIREQALSALSRIPRGEGVPALMQMTRGSDSWLAAKAMNSLASSGDPRVREFLRTVAANREVSDEVRVSAIRGLGRSYATADDAAFLRGLFPRLTTTTAKDAVVSAAGDAGGRENIRWLMTVAGDVAEPIAVRRKMVSAAERAGVTVDELAGLYGRSAERALKEEIIGAYARRNDAPSTDRLLAIARQADEDRTLRRSAITRLSRSSDPRVVAALKDIVLP